MPVREDHPLYPTEVNSADKAAGELYYGTYWHAHSLHTCSLRLTNTYGPRMPLSSPRQGFINWFFRLAFLGEEITLYGKGSQRRDMIYVDDAVEAFLLAGANDSLNGVSFNVGSGTFISVREIAETLVSVAGAGSIRHIPFPDESRRIEVGDFVADIEKIKTELAWQPRTRLKDGVIQTCAFYADHLHYYC